MSRVKTIAIAVASTVAVTLGTILFFAMKLLFHRREREDAESFLQNAPPYHRDKVLEDLGAKRESYEETVDALTHEVEEQGKEEIIEAFKKAFGVRPDHHIHGDGTGSAD